MRSDTTDAMAGIAEYVRTLGYEPEHIPDNDYCNETVRFHIWGGTGASKGPKVEIELGGPGCSGGADAGEVVLMRMAGGFRCCLADPTLFDKISSHVADFISRHRRAHRNTPPASPHPVKITACVSEHSRRI